MGIYQDEEIVALRVGETRQVTCRECATSQQWSDMTEEDIITRQNLEKKEFIYFCDTCKKKLNLASETGNVPRPSRLVSTKSQK